VTQTLALKRPAMKKMFGIPEAPKASEQPAFKNKLDGFNPITSFINVSYVLRQYYIRNKNEFMLYLF
jgi:hypothetical protein